MHAYRSDRAFDGERIRPDGALVLVDGERIVGVEPGDAPAPSDCPVTYLPETTMLPGLIDAHVHLCADSGPRALDQLPELDPIRLADIISGSLATQLAAGVTTVRDLGDIGYAVVDRRGGEVEPTVLAAGPPITSIGGHCADLGGGVAGVDNLRRAVRERVERGVDVVKIMTSGGVMTATTDVLAVQFTVDELRAVVDEAHRLDRPVTAHAHPLSAVQMCLAAGVDGIEHCTCLTAHGILAPPELVVQLAAAGTVVCLTLGRVLIGEPPPHMLALMARTGFSFEGCNAQAGEFYRGGVRLISGSDAGINAAKPHGVLPMAIADLVAGGMPPVDALVSATSAAADGIGVGDRKGRLRAGHDADLVIVDGDPTRDITALHSVRAVVIRGQDGSGRQ